LAADWAAPERTWATHDPMGPAVPDPCYEQPLHNHELRSCGTLFLDRIDRIDRIGGDAAPRSNGQGDDSSSGVDADMNAHDDLRELPARADHNCFGCSQTNAAGLKMRFSTNGEALFSTLTVPDHLCGWGTIVHGGVQTTILDEIMGWTALHLLKRVTLTKALSVEFLKPVHVNRPLHAIGRVRELTGAREARLEAELFNGDGKLCTRAMGTFGLFTMDAVKKLKILDEEVLKTVEHLVQG